MNNNPGEMNNTPVSKIGVYIGAVWVVVAVLLNFGQLSVLVPVGLPLLAAALFVARWNQERDPLGIAIGLSIFAMLAFPAHRCTCDCLCRCR